MLHDDASFSKPPGPGVVEGLLAAYAAGVFPMGCEDAAGGVVWCDPPRRGVIGLHDGGLRVSRSLRRRIASGRFRVTVDRAFGDVVRWCSRPGGDAAERWIVGPIPAWYGALHRAGHAHSVEAWLGDELVGGLYGVTLRGLFAGESMFSRPDAGGTDASKVCLVSLWGWLRAAGYVALDCQFWTPHLGRMGCVEIARRDYRRLLWSALGAGARWSDVASMSFDEGAMARRVGG